MIGCFSCASVTRNSCNAEFTVWDLEHHHILILSFLYSKSSKGHKTKTRLIETTAMKNAREAAVTQHRARYELGFGL